LICWARRKGKATSTLGALHVLRETVSDLRYLWRSFLFRGTILNWRDLWQALYFVSCEKIKEKPRHLRDAV